MEKKNYSIPSSNPKNWLWIVMILIVLITASVGYFFVYKPTVQRETATIQLLAAIENPDLGSQIFEKTQNPISGELPETVASVPNPLAGVYQNPFGE